MLMVDLTTLGLSMVMAAIGMAYVATMCFIISHLIDGWLENKFNDFLFWLGAGLLLGGPGVIVVGMLI